jgi:DNA ligase-1
MKFSTLVDFLAQLEATSKRLEMTRILGDLFKKAEVADMAAIAYLTQERLAPQYEAIEFGMGEALIAQAVAQATNTPLADVKKLYKQRGDYGNVVEELSKAKSKGLEVDQVFEKLRDQLSWSARSGNRAQCCRGEFGRTSEYDAHLQKGALAVGAKTASDRGR